jgi:cell division septum initiation protein DivIVA
MEISPYVNNHELLASDVTVRVNTDDRKRIDALLAQTSAIVMVNNNDTYALARHAAGRLKAMIDEVEDARKGCQRPFKAISEAVMNQARAIGKPVNDEHQRILGLLNNYVENMEREAEAVRKRQHEQRIAIEREHQRRITEALEARRQAEEAARTAKNEAERERARADSMAALARAAQEQLAQELAAEIAEIGNEPRKGLVPDGRVNHTWEFKLVNVHETIKAGSLSLLRFELDKLACLDSVKAQLAIDPNTPPSLPGITVTQRTNVSVRASAGVA